MKHKPLRIGIIVPQFPTYTETFFVNQVAGLCKEGHEVIVFSHTKQSEPSLVKGFGLDAFKNLTIVNFDFSTMPLEILKTLATSPAVFFKKFTINFRNMRSAVYRQLCILKLNKYACDIYHFGYSGIALTYLDFFQKISGKKMVSCRGTAENVLGITETGRPEKLRELFKKTDSIHCVSNALAKKVINFGAPKEKVFINQPATDIQLFSAKENTREANTTLKILSVGRMVFQKGYMPGLLAIAELRKNFDNFVWILAGDGPGYEELIFTINLLQLNDHVSLKGRKNKNEIKALYAEADIFFLPSVSEGIANVVLEAMAMELPVVSSNCGGMREVITHNVDGMLCENYDIESFAAALLELCHDAQKRKQFGTMARKRVEEAFTLKRFDQVYEGAYLQLIDE